MCVKSRFPRLGAPIPSLDGFLHDNVTRAKEKLHAAREKNKDRFNRTHRLRLRKIEEGDWVLVYDISLDNQHRSTRKFAKRWFGPCVVTSANGNATSHLTKLDGTRITTLVAWKQIKAFKKPHEAELDPTLGIEGDVSDE